MAKRVSWPMTIHCQTEWERDMLYEAIMTLKDIYCRGTESERIPPYSNVEETRLWARMTMERCISKGVWLDQEEEFELMSTLEERV